MAYAGNSMKITLLNALMFQAREMVCIKNGIMMAIFYYNVIMSETDKYPVPLEKKLQ